MRVLNDFSKFAIKNNKLNWKGSQWKEKVQKEQKHKKRVNRQIVE